MVIYLFSQILKLYLVTTFYHSSHFINISCYLCLYFLLLQLMMIKKNFKTKDLINYGVAYKQFTFFYKKLVFWYATIFIESRYSKIISIALNKKVSIESCQVFNGFTTLLSTMTNITVKN